MAYSATDVDQLGFLLNKEPYDSQTQVLRSFLSRYPRNTAVKLVNHPIKRYSGQTSVHLAATNGLWECLEILLLFGGNPNATSAPPDLCQTPLHLAARKGYERCLQILLENGANMEIRNTRQEKAIHLVKGKVHCERVFNHAIARFHIPKRSKEQQQRVDDLHLMLAEEKFEEFYQLYDQLPVDHKDLATRWTDFYQSTLLYRAAANNLDDPVAFLLERSPNQPLHNLNTFDTPLLIACRNNNLEVASMLLTHSPGLVFIQDAHLRRSPLHLACSKGNVKLVEAILEALDKIIKLSHHQVMFTLDFLDDSNRTPLFNACYYGFTEIVKLLIKFRKDHNESVTLNLNSAIKVSQRTPLHVAVKRGSLDIVKHLLSTEDVEVSPEARPSKDTHRRFVHLIQRQRHGRMLPMDVSFDETEQEPSNDPFQPEPKPLPSRVKSPPTTASSSGHSNTMTTQSSESPSSDYQMPNDEIKLTTDRSAFTMPKKRSVPSLYTKSSTESIDSMGISKPIRSITNAMDSSESAIAVFLTHMGKFQVLPKDTPGGLTIFDKLLVTPLAEACVYGREDVVALLLENGARDTNGLACRIAHILQNMELMELILSYDCALVEPTKEQKTKYGTRAPHWLHLLWSNKSLPHCSGSWFSENVVFHPPLLSDWGDTCTYSRSRSLPLRKMSIEVQQQQLTRVHANRIKEISIDSNNLTEVPIEVFKLPEVHVINLSRNSLSKMPEATLSVSSYDSRLSGWACSQLTELNISKNKLQKLPSCVWFLPNLQILKATGNELASLLPDSNQIVKEGHLSTSLQSIDVSSNKLTAVPDFIFKFEQLKQVNVSSNSLISLPETMWMCKSLQELDVSKNQLNILPKCQPEGTFDLSREVSGSVSTVFGHSDRVTAGVDYVNSPISPRHSLLRKQPSMFNSVTPLTEASEMSLSFSSTMSAVESCDYSSLVKLNLAKNKLTHYPEALPCLAPNLTELDVSDNKFEQIDIQFIPQAIKKFSARRCGLKRFGNTIDKKMHAMVTRNCRFSETFGGPCQHRAHPRLPCLSNLHLTKNKLQYFQLAHHMPSEDNSEGHGACEKEYITGLSSPELLYPVLEGLDLSFNNLQGIFNPNIGYQQHLQWIWLNGNENLEKLPLEFSYLKNSRQFTELQFCDLPKLVDPPQEYQSDTVSLSHLLSYMRSRLKESECYRTIKLFFIGNGRRGKTTLLRRLQGITVSNMKKLDCDRTIGIDVVDWYYPTGGGSMFKNAGNPVHFLAWDFAGQDIYHTTHQCFYSRRSLYLALFRLSDGISGIEELEHWLRNVKLRAAGCPVIIIGSHLDKVSESEAAALEKKVLERYGDTSIYPKIIATTCINSVSKNPLHNHMERLRSLIYNVACHLQLTKDGYGLEYKPDMKESDPKALFQQLIPTSFRTLQDQLRVKVQAAMREGAEAPIMEEAEFRREFLELFEDEEELQEAVYCLHLQGTLLHFEDHGLKNIYFLDPQWLAKLMANVIQPSSLDEDSPIKDGVADVNALFTKLDVPQTIKDKYINLLEKFEVALTIKGQRIIIPSLLPDSTCFPKTDDNLSDVKMFPGTDDCYQPPLRRLWLSGYIPKGFWPRLICRVVNDQQIGKILRTIIGDDPDLLEEPDDDSEKVEGINLDWTPWKTGIVYKCKGRTLLLIKQEADSTPDDLPPDNVFQPLNGDYRIEVHIYTNEWISLANYLSEQGILNSSLSPDFIPGLATRLLVVISTHIKSLAINYFSGMLLTHQNQNTVTYMPCWKCFAEIDAGKIKYEEHLPGSCFIWRNKKTPVTCFGVEDSVIGAIKGEDFGCAIHGSIKAVHLAPDLIFWDLVTQYEESSGSLHILENEVLGKGGFGFVCRGELTPEYGSKKQVAVKVFLQGILNEVEHSTIQELLALSQEQKNIVFAYNEIRQEVSFLASLNSPFLTELCGVKLNPYMCLMLELAPKQSLRAILKHYKENKVFLEPLTIKNTALQISKGLEYLHRHQVVHLDVKSPNVLVWHFPSPKDSRQLRVRQAGDVWIKLADYGISQLSTRQTLKVGNNPMGTPGFMAAELFDSPGQELFAEKVDVFALGMTFYEMLSQRTPFDNVHPHLKRNQEVRNKHRPILNARETRSLILFQDLMQMCWDHDPENRPYTKQIVDWIEAPEFERLRAQISLKGVKSISCACVCRILRENEEEVRFPQTSVITEKKVSNARNATCSIRDSLDMSSVLDKMEDIFKRYNEAEPDTGGSPSHNILLTSADDATCIEKKTGEIVGDKDEDIYQFLPSREEVPQEVILEGGVANEEGVPVEFEPYTQIWTCGRDERKGVLQVFTYNDRHAGHLTFSGFCSSEEITAICPVRNLMWMGTANGTIKIFHAPTLKVRFAAKMTIQGGGPPSFVLNILHVEEAGCVMVASHSGEIWIFSDRVLAGGLKVRERITLPEFSPCFHLVKVPNGNPKKVEVWGTMDHNRILVLERHDMKWIQKELEAKPGDSRLNLCSYITHTTFTGHMGAECSHVWVSYRNRSLLVSFDSRTRQQRCKLNCAEYLRNRDDHSCQVVTMVAKDVKLFVGTSGGVVGVFHSETVEILNIFSWHKEKVRTLLVMPKEMEPCICNEIPFKPESKSEDQQDGRKKPKYQRGMSAFDYMQNQHCIHNNDPDAVMVTSIGNGRRRYQVNEQSKQDRIRIFNETQSIGRRPTALDRHGEDIVLLQWRS